MRTYYDERLCDTIVKFLEFSARLRSWDMEHIVNTLFEDIGRVFDWGALLHGHVYHRGRNMFDFFLIFRRDRRGWDWTVAPLYTDLYGMVARYWEWEQKRSIDVNVCAHGQSALDTFYYRTAPYELFNGFRRALEELINLAPGCIRELPEVFGEAEGVYFGGGTMVIVVTHYLDKYCTTSEKRVLRLGRLPSRKYALLQFSPKAPEGRDALRAVGLGGRELESPPSWVITW